MAKGGGNFVLMDLSEIAVACSKRRRLVWCTGGLLLLDSSGFLK